MPFNYKTELGRYRRYYQAIENVAGQPRVHEYTAAIFSFLAISLFGWYAIRPTLQTILFLRKEIEDDKKVSQKMEEKITTLIQAQSTFQSAQQDLPLIGQALPEDPNAIDVLRQLKSLAQISQASLSAVTISSVPFVSGQQVSNPKSPAQKQQTPTQVIEKVVDVPTSLTLSGRFSSIDTFLSGLSSMRRIITIDSMSIKPDTETTSTSAADNTLRLVLKLNIHYLSP